MDTADTYETSVLPVYQKHNLGSVVIAVKIQHVYTTELVFIFWSAVNKIPNTKYMQLTSKLQSNIYENIQEFICNKHIINIICKYCALCFLFYNLNTGYCIFNKNIIILKRSPYVIQCGDFFLQNTPKTASVIPKPILIITSFN
jgi:hypothetical protein